MFVLASLILACASTPDTPAPPPEPPAPSTDDAGGTDQTGPSGDGGQTPANNELPDMNVMGPSWGDGTTEIWSGSDMVGVAFVEVSSGNRTEHIAMFQGSLAANTSNRWDPTLDGITTYAVFAPNKDTGTPSGNLVIKPFVKCSSKNNCAPCDVGGSSCYSSFSQFKTDVWGDIAERIGKQTQQVENLSKQLADTNTYSTSTFSTSACTSPTVTEYSPPRNNGLQKNGNAIGWLHMATDSSDSSKRILRQAVDNRDATLPHATGTFTQDVSWPPISGGGNGPWALSDWCTAVNTWCSALPAGVTCDYTEMTLSYPSSW
ncbi:MAG: hypothetical protein H6742_18450 [Alphaproteobacteria bacterium]|nr:hypothetical protein [Alphaproteobacteria bacterium]